MKYILEYTHMSLHGSVARGYRQPGYRLPDPTIVGDLEKLNIEAESDEYAIRVAQTFVAVPTGEIFKEGTDEERVLRNIPRRLLKEIKIFPTKTLT